MLFMRVPPPAMRDISFWIYVQISLLVTKVLISQAFPPNAAEKWLTNLET